jgi:hypothetical protein
MNKQEMEEQLKDLQEKLSVLKVEIASKEKDDENIYPIVQELEESAAKLKGEDRKSVV